MARVKLHSGDAELRDVQTTDRAIYGVHEDGDTTWSLGMYYTVEVNGNVTLAELTEITETGEDRFLLRFQR